MWIAFGRQLPAAGNIYLIDLCYKMDEGAFLANFIEGR